MGIKFEEPSSDRSGRGGSSKYDEITAELRARPGEWAVVAENMWASTASHMKNGALKAFRPAGAYETTTRGVTREGRAEKIYARYVGD